ncbi:TonB-dependent receptor [Erythrobacter sp. YT30]|uniref:TonB-dependent receptor n=1 Tax=Erythrobacter sp. YT30 TaxID=1735012 RepID=UPI001F2ADE66|nr:TonB-dependent receptor [Erythrobacter sp. YT30]
MASKRDLRVDQIAGPVAVIVGSELQIGGVGGSERIAQRATAVTSTHLGSGRNKLFIRGIADSSFTGPTQATVGQYLGDLRLSYNAPDPDLRLSDLERVEVLEGPQGTLYGAGSLGGIIRLVPRTPQINETSAEVSGGASFTQDGAPGADFNLTSNLPLVEDKAALRLTIDAASQGGYIDKPLLHRKDVNRNRILSGRLAAKLELTSDWELDLLTLGQITRARDSQYATGTDGGLQSLASVREGASADYLHGQLAINGDFGDLKLRSSTGFSTQTLEERYDATMPDDEEVVFTQRNRTRMFAHETRLWRPMRDDIGWIVGVSLTDNRTNLTRAFERPDSENTSAGVLNTVFEATGYGEASVRFFNFLTVGAGLRATYSSLGGGGDDIPFTLIDVLGSITATREEFELLPSGSIIADVAPSARLFARYQEGFRPGGLSVAADLVQRFKSDRTSTLEIGIGVGELDKAGPTIIGSVSRTRWRDIQADFIDFFGLPSTANIGDGLVWTASLNGSMEVWPGLDVKAGLAFNESEIDDPSFIPTSRTTTIPNIARWSGRGGLSWTYDFDDGTILDADLWVSYIGRSRLGIGPELGREQGEYLDSGATVRIETRGLGMSLSLFNIANVRGNRFALGTPFAIGREQSTPLQPRTIRIGVDMQF